jgi:hypothetical protein
LVGNYSKAVNTNLQVLNNHKLYAYPAKIYYLCGVSKPYKWANNFHLAFEYCLGEKVVVNRNGIIIVIENARELPIRVVPQSITDKKEFTTCRNWQFAVEYQGKFL